MTSTVPFWRKWIAALLLVMVSLHAAPSGAVVLERAAGSAFDASTADVAVAPKRQATAGAVVTTIVPAFPPVIAAPARAGTARIAAVQPRPDSTGPPATAVRARPALPRAPPAT
ncbi:MAG: hypothetical protein ABW203_02135 [Novosphingobium sp.]